MANSIKVKSLIDRDADVIWHPYTQHRNMQSPLPITRASGAYLFDENGNRYIDAISSWWTSLHGHSHPFIAEKIYQQALQLDHVIFAGCTHEPAVQLAENLIHFLPGEFSKVFYSDNGSTAVEVALKMCIQYWANKDEKGKRRKILALRHSYHGDTFGAMSVSERGVFTLPFEKFLFEVEFIEPGTDPPTDRFNLNEIACFIYEPLIQGAGGMRIYSSEWLNDFVKNLKDHDVICIADEVMTGFGRTGKIFASEYLSQQPDIICLSKGLTGGTLPLAATVCTGKIFDAFSSEDRLKTFFHGHSYTANPIACAAALASLELLKSPGCLDAITTLSEQNREFVNQLTISTKVMNPRSLGTILAFELSSPNNEYLNDIRSRIMNLALDNRVFLRPLGNTVYIMPPLCITAEEQSKIQETLIRISQEKIKDKR